MRIFTFKSKSRGFTLVEVLIAVGVMAVSISSMIGLLSAINANIVKIRQQQKATSLLSNLETTVRMKKFDEVYRWVSNPAQPYVVYFWDEYQNPEDPDNSSLVTMSSELEGMLPQQPPTKDTIEKTERDVYRVLLTLYQSGLKGERVRTGDAAQYGGGGLSGDASTYALSYLPINIEIMVDPKDDVISGAGDERTNEQRRIYQDIITKIR